MGAWVDIGAGGAMATRWRRRRPCLLVGAGEASIVALSGRGVDLDTRTRPALGSPVTLSHPDAGTIVGTVDAHRAGGISLRLDGGEAAVAFALAAILADMSRAG